MVIDNLIKTVKDEVIGWRRYLHQYPELSFQEEKTAQFVYETLTALGNLEITRPTKTSVVARLVGSRPGKVLALRADMDALAIQEENSFDFVSKHPGVMHACGHDGHTAMLLGTAKVLSQLQQQIPGEVRFIFQHAEELFPGGAKDLIKAGVLKGVDRVMGLHLMSHIPTGKIGVIYGPAMAASDTFDATIQGIGGHASQPHLAIDPIAIGAQVVTNLQHIVARKIDPLEKLVISVTKFHSGTAYNVIPDTVSLSGSVRSFSKEMRQAVPQLLEKIIHGITKTHGASYKFEYHHGYDCVINDEKVTGIVEKTIENIWSKESVATVAPLMGSEDFSFYANEVPGCYVFVGTGNKEKGFVYPMHHPKFTVDEDSLATGVKLYVHTAFALLADD